MDREWMQLSDNSFQRETKQIQVVTTAAEAVQQLSKFSTSIGSGFTMTLMLVKRFEHCPDEKGHPEKRALKNLSK